MALLTKLLPEATLSDYRRSHLKLNHRLHMLLWRLAHGHSYPTIAVQFSVGWSTCADYCTELLISLADVLPSVLVETLLHHDPARGNHTEDIPADSVILNAENVLKSALEVDKIPKLPDFCVSKRWFLPGAKLAIDGSHVPYSPPRIPEVYDDFINRKQYPSLNCVCIVDALGRIVYLDPSPPGGMHDATAFKLTELYREKIQKGKVLNEGEYILGDSAYDEKELYPWLFCPFPPSKLRSNAHARLSYLQSTLRIKVECTLGQLKNKFRILLHQHQLHGHSASGTSGYGLAQKTVLVCACLFNFSKLLPEHDRYHRTSQWTPSKIAELRKGLLEALESNAPLRFVSQGVNNGSFRSVTRYWRQQGGGTIGLPTASLPTSPKPDDSTYSRMAGGQGRESKHQDATAPAASASAHPDDSDEAESLVKEKAMTTEEIEAIGLFDISAPPTLMLEKSTNLAERGLSASSAAGGTGVNHPLSHCASSDSEAESLHVEEDAFTMDGTEAEDSMSEPDTSESTQSESDSDQEGQIAKRRKVAKFSLKAWIFSLPPGSPIFELPASVRKAGGHSIRTFLLKLLHEKEQEASCRRRGPSLTAQSSSTTTTRSNSSSSPADSRTAAQV